MLHAAVAGLFAGLSLIIAIGAQNAFVLRQGIARSHVGPVVAVCALADLLLIAAGVAGLGGLIVSHPSLVGVVRWVGAIFLAGYGLMALRRAVRPGAIDPSGTSGLTRRAAVTTALAFTFLNPHVYLDTVVLLGSIAATHGDEGRWWFGAGAGTGSILWFTALGYGARFLRPVFARERSWQVLDIVIGIVMITLAATLVLS